MNKSAKVTAAEAALPEYTDVTETSLNNTESSNKIGTFIVINTRLQRGLRLNLAKIRTYCKAGSDNNTIQISYDNNGGTNLQYGTEAEANTALELLDSYCL